jgi:hypothetical protein
MTAQDHNKLLSILFFIKGGLLTIVAAVFVIIYGMFGAIFGAAMMAGPDKEAKLAGAGIGGFFIVFAIGIGLFIMLFASLYLFTGWKLQKQQPIAKTMVTIASCLALLSFPLGTALGIYGLWFIFGDMGKAIYSGGRLDYPPPPTVPPGPHSWQ